ncbi:MAG: hypothetical protein ACRCVT_14180 [Leadbetterella sp.]
MKLHISILALFICFSCKTSKNVIEDMRKEEYRHVSKQSDDLNDIKKAFSKSNTTLQIDFETGDFEGKIKDCKYTGKFKIKNISSGFSKGFFYQVEVEKLSHDSLKTKKQRTIISQLNTCEEIYIAPDRLLNPTYISAELKSKDSKLYFYLLK